MAWKRSAVRFRVAPLPRRCGPSAPVGSAADQAAARTPTRQRQACAPGAVPWRQTGWHEGPVSKTGSGREVVGGSNPSVSAGCRRPCCDAGIPEMQHTLGPVAQLVRALACHARGRRFESGRDRQRRSPRRPCVAVAQLVRAPGCGPGGRRFEPARSPHARLVRAPALTPGGRAATAHSVEEAPDCTGQHARESEVAVRSRTPGRERPPMGPQPLVTGEGEKVR